MGQALCQTLGYQEELKVTLALFTHKLKREADMETGGSRSMGQPRQRQHAVEGQRRDSASAWKNQRGVNRQGDN